MGCLWVLATCDVAVSSFDWMDAMAAGGVKGQVDAVSMATCSYGYSCSPFETPTALELRTWMGFADEKRSVQNFYSVDKR